MTTIKEIYEETRTDIPFEEFKEKVEARNEKMGKIVGKESAAHLVAEEVGDDSSNKIEDVTPEQSSVEIIGKITGIGNIKEFEQDNADSESEKDGSEADNRNEQPSEDESTETSTDGSQTGKVLNITVADQSDNIKVAFWYSKAETVQEQYKLGDNVRIKGTPRESYGQTEISADNIEHETDITVDIEVGEASKIADLTEQHEMVEVDGIILSSTSINEFTRDDGSQGQVSNLIIGDETGYINVALWDDAAELTNSYSKGQRVTIKNASPRMKDGSLVLDVGNPANIQTVNKDISFQPITDDIDSIKEDQRANIKGNLVYVGELKEFTRDDGSEGVVQNIEIKDETGQIRAALWGENIIGSDPDTNTITLLNAKIERGYEDNLEASVGYNATVVQQDNITPPEDTTTDTEEDAQTPTQEDNPSEDTNSSESASTQASTDQKREDDPVEAPPGMSEKKEIIGENNNTQSDQSQDSPSEAPQGNKNNTSPQTTDFDTEVTGVVLGNDSTITLDTQEGQLTVFPPQDTNVNLGQQITVRGEETENGIEAEEIF